MFPFLLVASCASIPTTKLPGAGAELPMLYMGGGNFTAWVELAGKGAGVKTAWEYHNQQSVAAQISGFAREDIFLESMIPCGFVDHPAPMNASTATYSVPSRLSPSPLLLLLLLFIFPLTPFCCCFADFVRLC